MTCVHRSKRSVRARLSAKASIAARFRSAVMMVPILALAVSCADRAVVVPELPDDPKKEREDITPEAPLPVGVFRITLSGFGSGDMIGSVADLTAESGMALNPVTTGINFLQISGSSFTEGTRGQGGHRYINFVYRIRNSTGAPLNNLTFIMVSNPSSISGTPFGAVRLFNGANADPQLAVKTIPTGAVALGEEGWMRGLYPDVLQAFTEAEVAAIALPPGYTGIFPYGFVTRNMNGGRVIANNVDANDFQGLATFAFRIPLHVSGAANDAFSITFDVLGVQDTETRMTESIEEGADTTAVRRLRQRATALGATTVTVLNGSGRVDPADPDYPGQRQICSPRTAGTAASPVTFINEPGPFVELMMLRPNESLHACAAHFRTVTGTVGRPATNVSFPVQIRAVDRYGNLRTAVAEQVRFEQTGAVASMPGPVTLASGQGSTNITYTDYGTSLIRMFSTRGRGWQTIPVAGVVRTWSGALGTDWHTGGNWSPAAVPMSLDSVYIPLSAPVDPVIAANVQVMDVTVEDGATIAINAFDLTSNGNVIAGLTGGITNTTGRLILAGTAKNVQGRLPRVRVTGTYNLTGNMTTRARVEVSAGRLRSSAFRLRSEAF